MNDLLPNTAEEMRGLFNDIDMTREEVEKAFRTLERRYHSATVYGVVISLCLAITWLAIVVTLVEAN